MAYRQSMDTKDQSYYDVLGVDSTASDMDIKLAYRRLVLYWHPDKQFHDPYYDPYIAEENLKKINEAYSKLKTPHVRKQYNQILNLQEKVAILSRFENRQNVWGKFWHWLTMLESNKK